MSVIAEYRCKRCGNASDTRQKEAQGDETSDEFASTPRNCLAVILRGTGKINGDGWKDTTRKGEVVFVWNTELPSPHSPGQYPRVGNEVWSASVEQYDFTPATASDCDAVRAALASQNEAKPAERTKTAVGDDLAEAMRSAILRFETIQETHPDIALDEDLCRYREALDWYRRIPSPERQEAVFASEKCGNASDTHQKEAQEFSDG